MTHFLIIANGDFLSTDLIAKAAKDKRIVALDGAYNRLAALNILPDIVLGDFDSIDQAVTNKAIEVIHAPDQHKTDLIKGIEYCDQQGAASISIICAAGGRMDHHEAAMRSLRRAYRKDRPMCLHTEQQTIRFVKDESLIIMGKVGDKCGILAYPAAVMTSSGLRWDVRDYKLEFAFSDSTSNELSMPTAEIHISGEALIIMTSDLRSG